jgi:hypothetical protein
MRLRNNIILLVILAALGGYVYFKEFRGKDDQRKQEDAKRKVFQFAGKDIEEITVIQDGSPTITGVRKNDKDWALTEPAGLEADSAEWETLASHVVGLEKEKVASENATDLAPFGLSHPAVQLSVKQKGGEKVDILFGDENPLKMLRYVKLSTSPEVFLSSNSLTNFKKSLTDLRNKTVLEINPENVDRLVIVDGAKKTSFKKSGEDWMLDQPIEARADNAEVSGFIGTVQFARASEFADASIDAKKAGLDPPTLQVTLHDTKAQMDRTVVIGKEKDKDKFYAKDAARPVIFVIDKQLTEKLRRPQMEWRDKTIAKVDRDKTDEIEIVKGADKISLKKTGSDWKLGDGRKVSSDMILGMMDILDFERAKDILEPGKTPPSAGLDKPKLQATFREGGKETARLAFGADSSKPEGIYVRKADGTVLVVSKEIFGRYDVKADDLVEKALPELPLPDPAKK